MVSKNDVNICSAKKGNTVVFATRMKSSDCDSLFNFPKCQDINNIHRIKSDYRKFTQLFKKYSVIQNMTHFITHHDSNSFTNEGLGSHARGSLYPLLNIAMDTGLIPVLDNETFWSNSGRNYNGIDFSNFFNVNSNFPDNCIEMKIDTWKEAFGQTDLLIDIIRDLNIKVKETTSVIVVLMGPLRYVNPSSKVLKWLNLQCTKWHINNAPSLVVHIRRGDMDVESNQIQWFIDAIRTVNKVIPQVSTTIVTEDNFTSEEEMMIRKEFPWINVTRGGSSTVLDDVRTLASSNILIASNSHFSALGGYLAPEDGIIVVDPNNVYFQPHKDMRSNVYTLEGIELNKKLTAL